MGKKKKSEIGKGSVVKSVSGRDIHRVFIVIEEDSRSRIAPIVIADGQLRTLSQRKHKNPAHLKVIATLTDEEKNELLRAADDILIAKLCKKYDI